MFASAKAFAKWMLRDNRLLIAPDLSRIRCAKNALEVVLYRDGFFQAELVAALPGQHAPIHRHLHVDSWELAIGGSANAVVDAKLLSNLQRGPLMANLIHIPLGAWHGGDSGPDGLAFISFQQWDIPPTFITDDWQE